MGNTVSYPSKISDICGEEAPGVQDYYQFLLHCAHRCRPHSHGAAPASDTKERISTSTSSTSYSSR